MVLERQKLVKLRGQGFDLLLKDEDDKVFSVLIDHSLAPEGEDLKKSLPDDFQFALDAPEVASSLEALC